MNRLNYHLAAVSAVAALQTGEGGADEEDEATARGGRGAAGEGPPRLTCSGPRASLSTCRAAAHFAPDPAHRWQTLSPAACARLAPLCAAEPRVQPASGPRQRRTQPFPSSQATERAGNLACPAQGGRLTLTLKAPFLEHRISETLPVTSQVSIFRAASILTFLIGASGSETCRCRS